MSATGRGRPSKKGGRACRGRRGNEDRRSPGTYSLTAFSEEEKVAREFIIHEAPDVIVLLVNAAALERSLYLLAELLLLGSPVIVAVNMLDVAEAQGIRVDAEALEKALGLPVVPMIATKTAASGSSFSGSSPSPAGRCSPCRNFRWSERITASSLRS